MLPVIEFEDASAYRAESKDMAAAIRGAGSSRRERSGNKQRVNGLTPDVGDQSSLQVRRAWSCELSRARSRAQANQRRRFARIGS